MRTCHGSAVTLCNFLKGWPKQNCVDSCLRIWVMRIMRVMLLCLLVSCKRVVRGFSMVPKTRELAQPDFQGWQIPLSLEVPLFQVKCLSSNLCLLKHGFDNIPDQFRKHLRCCVWLMSSRNLFRIRYKPLICFCCVPLWCGFVVWFWEFMHMCSLFSFLILPVLFTMCNEFPLLGGTPGHSLALLSYSLSIDHSVTRLPMSQ